MVVAPTTSEQKLAKKNELKVRGTLLMALPDKHQLKFNTHKDAKSLMEAIEKRFGGNKETKKCKRLFSSSSVRASVAQALKAWIKFIIGSNTSLSNWKFLSNSHQLDNDDLKQIYADDLGEIDLKWQMAMLTMRARRFFQRIGRNLGANGTTSKGFDMSRNKDTQRRTVPVETYTSNALVSQCDGVGSDSNVAPCSKSCTKADATLQSHYDKLTIDFKKSPFDVLSYKTGLESVKARLVVYQQNENVFKEDIKLLKLDVMLRDNALVKLRKKFKKAEKRDDDELISSDSNESVPTSPMHDRYKSGEGETVPNVFNVEPSTTKPLKELSQSNRPSAPIIKDWVSDSEDESEDVVYDLCEESFFVVLDSFEERE
uniref:Uncharacterized protein n=1 Tax=Tanacetum cinerariifolium TaxID=118510 RepID=A0A699GM64_TANCI|nr:hypothetical protein [Tanacetum cinerariifolium]